jgi:hypothetical protein
VVFCDYIFRNVSYFESLQEWVYHSSMASWLRMFQTYVPWWQLVDNYAYLCALDATLVIIGLAVFSAPRLEDVGAETRAARV